MSLITTSHTTDHSPRSTPPRRARSRSSLRARGGRRVLSPVAGALFAAALVAGCGAQEPADPEDTVAEQTQQEAPPAADDPDGEGENADGGQSDGGAEDPDDGDDTPDEGSDDPDQGTDDAPGEDENLFEGSWHMGHHEKVLTAEELAAVLEEEALERGPDEMHLTVECEDGVDGPAGDQQAQCVAIGDEGAQNPWSITALPADAGLEIEVENVE